MDAAEVAQQKKTWERRLDEAKKKHRPKLKNWSRDGFGSALKRLPDFQRISKLPSDITDISHPRKSSIPVDELVKIDRISSFKLSVDEFIEFYEKPYLPLILRDIPEKENWNALNGWNLRNKRLFKAILGQRLFKVGEDDDGYKVKVRMKYFLKYLKHNSDDSPLYIFDGSFDDDAVSKTLLSDFKVPSYFPEDLFSLVGEKRRPPYRWFLMGPQRSGSCVHIDPLGTSAWNTLLQGRKRWVLFPPGTSKSVVKGTDLINKGEDDEAVNYFVDILPRIHKVYGNTTRIIEFTQEEGDTVFVPGGWWHAVLNIDDTIAATQNYCSKRNFEQVWRKTRTGRKKMSVKWLRILEDLYPDIAEMAHRINADDDFKMPEKSKKKSKDIDNSSLSKRSLTDGETSTSEEDKKKKKSRMS